MAPLLRNLLVVRDNLSSTRHRSPPSLKWPCITSVQRKKYHTTEYVYIGAILFFWTEVLVQFIFLSVAASGRNQFVPFWASHTSRAAVHFATHYRRRRPSWCRIKWPITWCVSSVFITFVQRRKWRTEKSLLHFCNPQFCQPKATFFFFSIREMDEFL